MAEVGYTTTKSRKQVMNWNKVFRKQRQFPHPNPFVANGIRAIPKIFECFPSAELDARAFVMNHFDHFTIPLLVEEFADNIIPSLMKKAEQDGTSKDSDSYILLRKLTDTPPLYGVVRRLVHYMGFHQDKVKKSYYVDGHENEEQQKHRREFIKKYLSDLEPYSHRWIHLTREEVNTINSSLEAAGENTLLHEGYSFVQDGQEMLEFHVDDHNKLSELANDKYNFGGCVSVRCKAGRKELIIFGQDESVFNQYMFPSRQWVSNTGERAIMPKTAGLGEMITAFISREVRYILATSLLMILIRSSPHLSMFVYAVWMGF
jgi:hypothetical protein